MADILKENIKMQNTAKFLMLRNIPLLSMLKDSEMQLLANEVIVKNYKKDEHIYSEKSVINFVYIVDNGTVKLAQSTVDDKTLIKDVLYSHSLFGENIFIQKQLRSEYAQVMEDSRIIAIPSKLFQSMFSSNHKFALQVTQVIIERLKNIETRIHNFVFLKAKSRIAEFIKKTANLKGIKIGIDEVLVNHGMSHKDISYVTDTSRQTVARVLGDFKRANIIHFSDRKPGKILIRNMVALN